MVLVSSGWPVLIHTLHLYLYKTRSLRMYHIVFKYCNNHRVFYIYCIGPAGCLLLVSVNGRVQFVVSCWFLYASKYVISRIKCISASLSNYYYQRV